MADILCALRAGDRMSSISAPMEASFPERVPSILVVEDEVLIRLAVVDHLQDRGFRVLAVSNAAEAIETLEANLHVDLVFTDVKMPGAMDGLDLAHWIRGRSPGFPIIIASGHARPERAGPGLDGVVYLTKPYDIGSVGDRVLTMLGTAPPGR
jgi:CheY-like chemotaxis protein